MTSEGLGEMFEGDSADMWAGRRVSLAQTRERGPPSALAEIFVDALLKTFLLIYSCCVSDFFSSFLKELSFTVPIG